MRKRTCKILFTYTCINVIVFCFAAPVRAQGLTSYGGTTIIAIPCTAMATWFLVYDITAGGPPNLMYSSAIQIDDDDKNHLAPGLQPLGLSAPATIPCLVYAGVTVITIGVGFPVIF